MGTFHTLDPDRCQCLIALVPISGWDESSMISVKTDGQQFTFKKGAAGDISRSKNYPTATLTFNLMNTSKSNNFLSALLQLDRNAPNGAGVFPVLVKDLNGLSLVASDICWIEQDAGLERGAEAQGIQWVFRLTDAKIFIAGT